MGYCLKQCTYYYIHVVLERGTKAKIRQICTFQRLQIIVAALNVMKKAIWVRGTHTYVHCTKMYIKHITPKKVHEKKLT